MGPDMHEGRDREEEVRDEDMPRHINEHMRHHRRMWGHGPAQWSSWDSPVGIGIFFVLSALATAIALHILITLVVAAASFMHPVPQYDYPMRGEAGFQTGRM